MSKKPTCSDAQLAANQQNSLKSTGPKGEEGKRVAKYNSLKHGLRCDLDVLPTECEEEYETEMKAWLAEFNPQNVASLRLVLRSPAYAK